MPTYDYRCEKCRKKFSLMMGIKDHDTIKVKCPKCKSVKTSQLITGFFTQTSKKS